MQRFDLVIRNGKAILPAQGEHAVDIATRAGRIAALLSPGTPADAAETLDAAGLTVMPGAIDVHLHLGHGKDIARPRVPEDAATDDIGQGVVYVFDGNSMARYA